MATAPAGAITPNGPGGFAYESPLVGIWRRFRRSRTAVVGLAFLLFLIILAIMAPLITKEKVDYLDLAGKNQRPSAQHWLGTDQFGRDVRDRIIWGSRTSLAIGFTAAGVAVLIGSMWGAIAGYYGGSWLDVTMMRIAEAVDLIPLLFLLLVVAAIVPRTGILTVMFIIGVTSWPGLAFLVRGQFLTLRETDYAQASRAVGARDFRIIFRHILPNVVAIIIVSATLRIGNAILAEAALGYLGYGAPPPTPSWGEAISAGRQVLRTAPWVATWPGIFITLTVLAFNFFGDGLRDALDPKLKR